MMPSSSISASAPQRVRARDEPAQLRELALAGRLPRAPRRGAVPGPAVSGSISSPWPAASRAARSSRSGSAANEDSETARRTPAPRSARPPWGSIGSPPSSGHRDRVDREVAGGEVVRDRLPAQRASRPPASSRPRRRPARSRTRPRARRRCPPRRAAIARAASPRIAGRPRGRGPPPGVPAQRRGRRRRRSTRPTRAGRRRAAPPPETRAAAGRCPRPDLAGPRRLTSAPAAPGPRSRR